MKWMGWSWLDYCYTPSEVIERVIEAMNQEIQERDLHSSGD